MSDRATKNPGTLREDGKYGNHWDPEKGKHPGGRQRGEKRPTLSIGEHIHRVEVLEQTGSPAKAVEILRSQGHDVTTEQLKYSRRKLRHETPDTLAAVRRRTLQESIEKAGTILGLVDNALLDRFAKFDIHEKNEKTGQFLTTTKDLGVIRGIFADKLDALSNSSRTLDGDPGSQGADVRERLEAVGAAFLALTELRDSLKSDGWSVSALTVSGGPACEPVLDEGCIEAESQRENGVDVSGNSDVVPV